MKNMKSLRNEAGISQHKLAEAIGSTQQAIHGYEHGDFEPDIQTMTDIARFFNTSIDYLVGNTAVRGKVEEAEMHRLTADEFVSIENQRRLSPEHRKILNAIQNTLLEIE
jgi:DNA-binding XRE family transcriptional regulator